MQNSPLNLVALIFSAVVAGCTTTGNSNNSSVLLGAVALSSSIAKASQSNDQNAHSVWCQSLHLVERAKTNRLETILSPEARSHLQSSIEASARQSGYRLHVVQVNALIDDAAAVLAQPDARHAELARCRLEPM